MSIRFNRVTQIYIIFTYKLFYLDKKFSALPGKSSSHREATVHPGAKISL